MKLRIMSDIHIEFGDFDVPELKDDKDSILIIAGDLGLAIDHETYVPFLDEIVPRFRNVIWVFGNHEYYHGKFPDSMEEVQTVTSHHFPDLRILENDTAIIDDVVIIGATLWSDFYKENPMAMLSFQNQMSDAKVTQFRCKSSGKFRRLLPNDTLEAHKESRDFIGRKLLKYEHMKRVVVTHHAPSLQSIAPCFKNSDISGAFASDLDDMIISYSPDVWVHGHTHFSFGYNIGDTKIVCNPRGYHPDMLNPKFNSIFVLDI